MSVATQTTVTGKVSRIIVRPKVIFASVYADGKPLQLTLFRQNAPSHYADAMMQWEVGQEVTATGTLENNPFNGEEQLVISALTGAAPKEQPVEQVALTQTITITKDQDSFRDQWGRMWSRVPDRF